MSDDDGATPAGRVRWLGALLILVALGALIWQAREAGLAGPAPGMGSPVRAVQPSLAGMLPGPNGLPPAAAPSVQAFAAPPLGRAAASPDAVAVCGIGPAPADADRSPESRAAWHAPVADAYEHMLNVLTHSGREAELATGLYLRGVLSPQAFAAEAAVPVPVAASAPARPAAMHAGAVDALARMAAASTSAQVYALAMNACARRPGEGACRLLTPAQWARLDPDNAVPWIYLADEAVQRRDSAAVAEALFQVAHATTSDARVMPALALAAARMPADTPPLAATVVSNHLLQVAFAAPPPYEALSRSCEKAALADANRWQACAAVAEVLTSRSGSLAEMMVGARIGEHAGWREERLQVLTDERDAISAQMHAALSDVGQLEDCGAQDRMRRRALALAVHGGEVGALRHAHKDSPETIAALAQRFRDSRPRPALDGSGALAH